MIYDTIVIGAGIAGLQTAIQLARCLRKVAVVDIPGGRSAAARCYRNILGFPQGISGEALRHAGKEQAIRYGAEFIVDEVIALHQDEEECFHILTRNGSLPLQSYTLVLATGICDPFPQIAGLRECLGISVFLCPDCDGFESVNVKTAVIGAGPNAIEMTKELEHYTKSMVVINHDCAPVEPELLARCGEGITFFNMRIERLLHRDGELFALDLEDGGRLNITRAFLAFPGAHVQTDLIRGFRVRLTAKGHVIVNPRTRETDHPNIWAVGDVVNHSQQVAIAMGDGAQAAIWIHKKLSNVQAP